MHEVKQNDTITTVGFGEIQKATEEQDLDVNMYKNYINPASETIRRTTATTRKNYDGKEGRKRAGEVAVVSLSECAYATYLWRQSE